jgi:hypothetical protein
MLNKVQVLILIALSAVFWVLATLYIHFLPGAFTNPVQGATGFITTLPIAWLSVLLTRSVARLSANQLLPGVGIVGAIAMMIDGIVLRWFPIAYSSDQIILRLGAAWLLWGYGVSLCVALLMSVAMQRKASVLANRAGIETLKPAIRK